MSTTLIIICGLGYLVLLFAIASYAQKTINTSRNLVNHPFIYALSMGVYCTAWTYYGSVGRAASSGIDFITIYLGPTIMAVLFWPVLRKILTISKSLRITSIADFISTRYGKNFSIGMVVTLFCVFGVIPYIALQIKAITSSIAVLQQDSPTSLSTVYIAIFSTIILFVFTVLYGARSVDAAEKHPGLMTVMAFESLVKLLAFLMVGVYITYFLFDGMGDIFSQTAATANNKLLTLKESSGYSGWMSMTVLGMLAIVFLPRQFQVSIVENVQEQHLKMATWLFPLYLILINIFVLPIAMGGLLLQGNTVNADYYVLSIPMMQNQGWLAMTTWIGGLSAATGMIIIETIALSIMISNHLVIPLLLRTQQNQNWKQVSLQSNILNIRRLSIGAVLLLALLYYLNLGKGESLVSIGLISFCAVAQFAPALFGGIYWKEGNKQGAIIGIILGFIIWFYTLVLPGMVNNGFLPASILANGLFGIEWLHPQHLFGLKEFDSISHSVFWSLLLNISAYVFISVYTQQGAQEQYQAEIFTNINKHGAIQENGLVWKGTAQMQDIRNLLKSFVGAERAETLLSAYTKRHKINLQEKLVADPRIIGFTERILGGVVGVASARILLQTVAKEEEISIEEVLTILNENQQMVEMNKELRKKSLELSKATQQLQNMNTQLLSIDEQKNEFLYTVTHELRTPLTSIRALSEILFDNPDLEAEQQQQYLEAIIKETVRLSNLITQVLNLENFEAGRRKLTITDINAGKLLDDMAATLSGIIQAKQLSLTIQLAQRPTMIQADADLIQQVFINLLGNAIKFASSTIQISISKGEKDYTIEITDDGKGIDAGMEELIFDKFFQAKNQTLKKPEGTGLGLAISKKIIELHGGKIWVNKGFTKGAQFVFTLPYEQESIGGR
ncbi:MAG: histidine kinase [Sediminibacterium sp.]|nr:MAG: histidine kinase [Sediminibacterium sp.] [Sediminibacterium sp. FEMGT703S]